MVPRSGNHGCRHLDTCGLRFGERLERGRGGKGREGLWMFGSGSFQETRFYISPHSSGYRAASLIRALQGWRRQADQPIKRAMPQARSVIRAFLVLTPSRGYSLLERSGSIRMQSDTRQITRQDTELSAQMHLHFWTLGDLLVRGRGGI